MKNRTTKDEFRNVILLNKVSKWKFMCSVSKKETAHKAIKDKDDYKVEDDLAAKGFLRYAP